MQMHPQQTQLPVNPTQITNQPIPVSPGQPHFIPMVQVPQQMQQYVPLVTSVVIMEIQSKMQQNPLRVFMFNLYSMNQYNNREFCELIEMCCHYIHLVMMNGREYNSIDGAIFGVSQNIVTMMACAQIKPYPALMQFLSPDLQQSAVNGARALETIVREITASARPQSGYGMQIPMRNGMGGTVATMAATGSSSGYGLFGQGNTQVPVHNSGVNVGHNSGGAVNRYRKQLAEQNGQGNQFNQQQNYGQYNSQSMQSQSNTQTSVQGSNRRTVADLIGNSGQINQPFKARDPAVTSELTFTPPQVMNSQPSDWFTTQTKDVGNNVEKQITVKQVNQSSETVVYAETSLPDGRKWARSNMQPYHPMWDCTKQKPMYAIVDDKTIIAVLVDLSEEEKATMDYDKHVIGRRPVKPNTHLIPETNDPGDKITNLDIKQADVSIALDPDVEVITMHAEEAIRTAKIKARFNKKLYDKNACIVRTILAKPVFLETVELEEELRQAVVLISTADSFDEVQDILKHVSAEGKTHLVPFLEQELVNNINSVLNLELGLDGVTIDSFKDVFGLADALSESFGEIVGNSIKKNQKLILRRLMILGKSESQTFTNMTIGEDQEVTHGNGAVVYSTTDNAYVCVKHSSHELKFTDTVAKTLLVTEDNNKELYAILTNSMDVVDLDNYRMYLVTCDDVVMQVAKGFINSDSILVRKV